MFAGDFQMLRNKRHFVISMIAINVFYCIILVYYFQDNVYTSAKCVVTC